MSGIYYPILRCFNGKARVGDSKGAARRSNVKESWRYRFSCQEESVFQQDTLGQLNPLRFTPYGFVALQCLPWLLPRDELIEIEQHAGHAGPGFEGFRRVLLLKQALDRLPFPLMG